MMRIDEGTLDERILKKQYEDALFRLALVRLVKKQADELQMEADACGDAFPGQDMEAAFRNSLPRVRRSIRRGVWRRQASVLHRRALPRIYRFVAAIVLLACIGITSALAMSSAARVYLVNLLINIEDEYTELSLAPDPAAYVDVPAGWEGCYFPSYIPEGYAMEEISGGSAVNSVSYTNDMEAWIYFDEMTAAASTNVDSEDAVMTMTFMHGVSLLQIEKGGAVTPAWAYADRYFTLIYEGPLEGAMKIAESVARICGEVMP